MKDLVSRCPIEEAMRLLSGRWPTLLLYYLKEGTKRFSDLKRDNPALSHRMLTLDCASSKRRASCGEPHMRAIRCGSTMI